jgi:uncharacterized protein YdgA (DUF945 family)
MTNFTSHLNEQLFTELTPTESADLNGGANFETFVNFDDEFNTRDFKVSAGGSVQLASFTDSAPSNKSFKADLIGPGNQEVKTVNVGTDNSFWKDLKGGNYKIQLRDEKDNINVKGRINVDYA